MRFEVSPTLCMKKIGKGSFGVEAAQSSVSYIRGHEKRGILLKF